MNSRPYIFLIALAIVVLGTIIYRRLRERGMGSFWDVVRNPGAMLDLDELDQAVDETVAELTGQHELISGLVHAYVFDTKTSRDADLEQRVLVRLGDQIFPRILEILRDPALSDRLIKPTGEFLSTPEAPIDRLCQLLEQDTPLPPETALLLAPYLQAESSEVRKSVAIILGSMGTRDCLPQLRRAFADEDVYVRSYAMIGIKRALKRGPIDPATRGELFEAVAGLWPADTSFNVCESLPQLLLELDRERAVAFLLAPNLLTVRFEPVWRILEALSVANVQPPRERLLAIIAETNQDPIEYPARNIVAAALPLLASHRHADDLPLFEGFLNHSDDRLSQGAAQAMYRYHRYKERVRDPRKVANAQGWQALTDVERHILAIQELDAEVRNGGFAQYYFNTYGNHWQHALAGLKASGASQRYELMTATLSAFPNQQPATDRSQRQSQLSLIARKVKDPFRTQDDAWYALNSENLAALICKYDLSNLDGRGL